MTDEYDVEIKPNIFQRIDKVRQAVDYIQKEKKVEQYKAVTHDQVTSIVRPQLIKYGIVTILRQAPGEAMEDTGKSTSGGAPITRYRAFYELDWVNMDDPTDRVTTSIGAIGEDYGDKGPGKSASYAVKAMMLKTLNIETGESDESRQEQIPTPISDDHYTLLYEKCKELGFPPEQTLKAMAEKVYRIKKIQLLPADKFDNAIEMLEKKHEKENETKK